jgi:sugar phosphate isomerase/epimerase
MRVSVSALAWPGSTDPAVSPDFAGLLARHGVGQIDIVPTKIWPDWRFRATDVQGLRTRLAGAGMSTPGMQSIFFKRVGLNVFADAAQWRRTRLHLDRIALLAHRLGIRAVAFGAPANRDPQGMEPGAAWRLALRRLRAVAPLFAARGTTLCLEPVPAGAFLRDHDETARFVREANVEGLAMVLDTAALHATVADPARAVARFLDVVRHVHASEPDLGPFATPAVDHAAIAWALRRQAYDGTVALEMVARDDAVANLDTALGTVTRVYGGA